jgi:hypothetical protein
VPWPAFDLEDTVGTAMLRIETRPESLQVFIDGTLVGYSPIGPFEWPARETHVRVLPRDPRRFGVGRDAADVTLARGTSTALFFDLRPSVTLRSDPQGALVTVTDRAAGDSLLGATPVAVPPAVYEGAALRFSAPAHADTVLSGAALSLAPEAFEVALRRVDWSVPRTGPTRGTPVYRKTWIHWTLVGVGAALSVSSIGLHQRADDYYAQYLASSDVDEIPYLYDQATKYDRLAGAALVVGQTALLSGIVMLLLGQRP